MRHQQETMKPPILQTNWHNRVAFRPSGTASCVETFTITVTDPRHPRALWLHFNLFAHHKERYGEVQAIFFDAATGEHHTTVAERFPADRIHIDPERAGVGIGENNIQESASVGRVQNHQCSLSWDFKFQNQAPAYLPLPQEWMYHSNLVQPKLCIPHPRGLATGKVELWRGSGRHVPVTRFDISGWRVSQVHSWSKERVEQTAYITCSSFTDAPEAYFQAFAAPMSIAKVFNPFAILARLVIGNEVYRFDTWRQLKNTPRRLSPTDWTFDLEGADGTLKGVFSATPKNTMASTLAHTNAGASHRFSTPFGQLRLELTSAQGRKRTLTSDTAAFSLIAPEPRGNASLASAA